MPIEYSRNIRRDYRVGKRDVSSGGFGVSGRLLRRVKAERRAKDGKNIN